MASCTLFLPPSIAREPTAALRGLEVPQERLPRLRAPVRRALEGHHHRDLLVRGLVRRGERREGVRALHEEALLVLWVLLDA